MASGADPELFREVFGRFATGVAVITSAGAGGGGGMTANAICSLSLDPLLALVCFENSARTLPIVREAGRFAVNVLGAHQEDLAGVFASKLPEDEKLEIVEHHLRGGSAERLGDDRHEQREEAVDEVKAARTVSEEHEDPAQHNLNDDRELGSAQQAPEPDTWLRTPPAPRAIHAGEAVQGDREHPHDEVDILHRNPRR